MNHWIFGDNHHLGDIFEYVIHISIISYIIIFTQKIHIFFRVPPDPKIKTRHVVKMVVWKLIIWANCLLGLDTQLPQPKKWRHMTSQRNCYKLHWCSQRCSWNSSLLKTLSKPLLLYKGPNLALALKVLILQYFHLSVTERDSPSSQISSLDGTSSSYPIYKPRTDPRLPVCRKLETGFLSCPHYACFVFFRKFVFLNCRRDSQYPKKRFHLWSV